MFLILRKDKKINWKNAFLVCFIWKMRRKWLDLQYKI